LEQQNTELRQAKIHALSVADTFTELYDFAASGYFTLSCTGGIISLNHFATQLLGKERVFLKNCLFSDSISVDLRPAFNHFLAKIFNSWSKESCVLAFSPSEKSPIYVHQTGIIHKDGEQCLVSAIDITERQQAEEKLIESDYFSRSILESIESEVAVLDEYGTIIAVNRAWRELGNIAKSASDNTHEGTNYLTVCDSVIGSDSVCAKAIAEGIRSVIAKNQNPFLIDYQYDYQNDKKWYVARVTRFEGEGPIRVVVTNEDITTIKQEQEKALTLSNRYKALLEAGSDGMHVLDDDGSLFEVNQSFCTMLGYTHEELLTLNLADWDMQWNRDELSIKLKELILKPAIFETRYRRKDGTLVDVEINPSSVTLNGSDYLFAATRDITEKKKSAQKLLPSEARYRMLFENMEEGFSLQEIITDQNNHPVDFRFLDANTAYERHTGMKPGDITGKTMLSLMPQSDPRQIERYGRVAQTGEPDTFEYYSNTFHRYLRVKAFCPQSGQFATVFEDITQFKQAELELRDSEARYRAMTANISDVISILDANGFIKYRSNNGEKYFGWLPDEIEATNTFLRVHPDDLERTQKVFRELQEKQDAKLTFEFRYGCKDGSYRPVEMTASNLLNDPLINGILLNYRNITERKAVEQALIDSEARYRSMTANIPEAISIMDAHGMMKYQSPGIEQFFGWSPEERIGTSGFANVHPDDLETAKKIYHQLMERENARLTFEFRYHCKDGSYKPVELTASNLLNDPLINGILLNYKDITARKKAETAIIESGKKWEAIVSASPDGIGLISLDGKVEFVSNNYAIIHGFTTDEKNDYLGRSVFDFIDPSSHPAITDQFAKLHSGKKESGESEYLGIKKDQSRFSLGINSALLYDKDGIPTNILVIGRDITERKAIQEQIKESEQRLQMVINVTEEGIWDWHLPSGRVIHNHQWYMLLGAKPGEIENTVEAFGNLIHPEDKAIVFQKIDAMLQGKSDKYYSEHRLVGKGRTIWVRDRGAIVEHNTQGNPVRMLGSYTDITKQREADAEIKFQNEKLRKINAEREKFFSIIAHDLRGPLGGFMGITEMMADESQYFSEIERKEMMSDLSRSARNTFNLLENLLEWSQMVQGRTDFLPVTLNLKELITGCVAMITEPAQLKAIKIRTDLSNHLEVIADHNMLHTVIRNLLTNALKFTCEGGEITVSALEEENNFTAISVKDTGIGMTEEMRTNLFRIDAKVKRPGTNGEHSTGLGLPLCKEFVEKQGGKISVESEQNKGTVFCFTIPTSGEQKILDIPAEAVKIHDTEILTNNLRIVVAEDDEISAKLISIIVKGISQQIIRVKTGLEAVETCRITPILTLC